VLLYACVTCVLGGPSPVTTVVSNIMTIAVLACAAGFGRRALERSSRAAFLSVARERIKRAELEREVDWLTSQALGPTLGRRVHSDDDSRSAITARTTHTEELFTTLARMSWRGTSATGSEELQRIADLGFREHWLLPTSQLRLASGTDSVLGHGSFGLVMKAKYFGAAVAVKAALSKEDGFLQLEGLKMLSNELQILRRLRHPNIVLFYGACVSPRTGELWLVMEFVHGAPLDAVVTVMPPSGPDYDARFKFTRDVCCALLYLHTQEPHIIHGDIKGGNVLAHSSPPRPHAKLTDFGLSRLTTRRADPLGGTEAWMAPEVLLRTNRQPAPSADVFSFGQLIYMNMTGRIPCAGDWKSSSRAAARSSQQEFHLWPEEMPGREACFRLFEACVRLDPRQRPSMQHVSEQLLDILPEASRSFCSIQQLPPEASLHDAISRARATIQEHRRPNEVRPPGAILAEGQSPSVSSMGASAISDLHGGPVLQVSVVPTLY